MSSQDFIIEDCMEITEVTTKLILVRKSGINLHNELNKQ